MDSPNTKIVPYSAQDKDDFVRLNRAWIEKYFKIESVDTAIFADPQKTIIDMGGFIFCALAGGKSRESARCKNWQRPNTVSSCRNWL